jgi:hypothetical protein
MTPHHEDLLEHISESKQTNHKKIISPNENNGLLILLIGINHSAKHATEKKDIKLKPILNMVFKPFSSLTLVE